MSVRRVAGAGLGGLALALAWSAPGSAQAPQAQPSWRIRQERTDIVLQPDGSNTRTSHSEVLAANDAAAMELGQFSLEYDAALSTLDVLEAHTLKKDGTKIPVDPTAIYDQLAQNNSGAPMLTEFHAKTIIFPQFAAGDTAVYTVRETTRQALLPGQFWLLKYFPHSVAYDDVTMTVSAPSALKLTAETHGVEFSKTDTGGQSLYRWHYAAPNPSADKVSGVSIFDTLPRFALSTLTDYAALGRAYQAAAAPKSEPTPQIAALADQITKGESDRRQQARKLYEWVSSHIRYVAVELGQGSVVPHAAQSVLSNGYGDCKDHVALLAALLKAKGIASEGVLINAGSDYTLTEAPTLAGLDHIITYVPEFHLYMDSTAAVAPFGALPFQEYGKPVVYAAPDNPRRGALPVLAPGVAVIRTNADLHLGPDGKLSGTTVTTGTGPYEMGLREVALATQSAGAENAAHNLLVALGYGDQATGLLSAGPPLQPGANYAVRGSFETNGWAEVVQGRAAFYMPGGLRVAPAAGDGPMGPLGENKLPADADFPCYSTEESEDLSLALPAGTQLARIPPDSHIASANVRFDATFRVSNGVLKAHRDFVSHIDQPLCTAQIRAANRAALAQIADSYREPLALAAKALVSQNLPARRGEAALRLADVPLPKPGPQQSVPALAEARMDFAALAAPASAEHLAGRPSERGFAAAPIGPGGGLGLDASSTLHFPPAMTDASGALRAQADRMLADRRFAAALAAYDAALKANPKDAAGYVGRAIAKRRLGHYAPAMKDVETAMALGDAGALARFQAGIGDKD